MIPILRRTALAAAAVVGVCRGDVIYQTNGPFFGPNGPPAFGLSDQQAVALRFRPALDCTLDAVRVWIISDNFKQVSHAPVRVQVRTGRSDVPRPSGVILEQMEFEVSALGWAPVLESVESQLHPLLRRGAEYWIVLQCDLHESGPGWNWSDGSTGFVALSYDGQELFNDGGQGAVCATIIEGTPACYANCDRSVAAPALNTNDFMCFLNAFATGDAAANCDNSTAPPVLNADDFACFMNAFAAGCS